MSSILGTLEGMATPEQSSVRDSITFDSTSLLQALVCARLWSSKDKDFRAHQTGVHLERVFESSNGPSRVYMVTTDGFGMWVRGPADYSTPPGYVFEVDLSGSDACAVVAVLKSLRRPCEVTFGVVADTGGRFARIGRTTLELEGLDDAHGERFPPWRKVIPKERITPPIAGVWVSPSRIAKAFRSLKVATESFATRVEFGAKELDPVAVRGTVAGVPTLVLVMPMRGEACDAYGAPK